MYDPESYSKKTFVFENEATGQSIIVYHHVNMDEKYTNLQEILNFYCPFHKNNIQLFNTYESRFVELNKINKDKPTCVPSGLLMYGFIMIRYKAIHEEQKIHKAEIFTRNSYFTMDGDTKGLLKENQAPDQEKGEEEASSSAQSSNKKDRSKERTIGEVIDLVRRWRQLNWGAGPSSTENLHSTTTILPKKLNLQESARVVGVSKKSLDDYYYQLRVGELNEFAFNENLGEKIGVLRNFVKDKKPEKTKKHRNFKHPKRLKIIEWNSDSAEDDQLNLNIAQSSNLHNIEIEANSNQFMNSPVLSSFCSIQEEIKNSEGSFLLGKDFEDFQNIEYNYYQNFEYFLIDKDEDPYFYTGDFKKKVSINFLEDDDIIF